MGDLEDSITVALWAWRRAEQALEDYQVPEIDDLSGRDGRRLDELKADVELHRQKIADLASHDLGTKSSVQLHRLLRPFASRATR